MKEEIDGLFTQNKNKIWERNQSAPNKFTTKNISEKNLELKDIFQIIETRTITAVIASD